MRNITYISLLTVAFALGACSDNELLDSSLMPEGNLTIQATIDEGQVAARTYIYKTSSILRWTATKDEIGIYGTSSSENVEFLCVSTTNDGIASFSGSLASNDSPLRAYYPYSENGGLSGDGHKTFKATLPSEITFEECSEAGSGRMATNAPMIAPTYDNSNNKFAFKHVCGLMRITISSIPTGATSLVITSEDQNIAGECTIADITTGSPQFTPPVTGSKAVTITLPKATTYTEKTFYIPLPVATYSKLTVELKKADEVLFSKSASNLTVACADLVDMNKLTGLELKPSEVKDALTAALATGGTVDVLIKDVTAVDATIELPTFPSGGSRTVNLLLAETPKNKLTIKKAEGEGSSIGTLNVKLPSGSEDYNSEAWAQTPAWTDAAGAPDFDINLPNTNVVLGSEGDMKVAQYGNVSLLGGYSSTIGNSLKGNITMNSLIINGGTNVNVTATVGKITISGSNSNTKQVMVTKGSNDGRGYCYDLENNTGRTITYSNTLVWDGTLKCKPLTDASGQYLIRSAAELAYFQRTKENALKGNVVATMDADAKLCCDINLNNKPWMGIVLAKNKTFDGNKCTISKLKVEEYSLEEISQATTRACAGLFSTTLQNSTVKDVILDNVNIAVEAKWCGSLIGHSYSKEVSGCTVKNATVGKSTDTTNPTHYSYRMGGLIGFVDCESNVAITNCSVDKATITGAYALGGLLGTTMFGYDVTVTGCSVKNITLTVDQKALASLEEHNVGYKAYGYNGKMVGAVQQLNGESLTFDNCSIDAAVTDEERTQWLCSDLKDETNHAFIGGNSWIGRVGGTDMPNANVNITLTNCTEAATTPINKTFVKGEDYNAYSKTE